MQSKRFVPCALVLEDSLTVLDDVQVVNTQLRCCFSTSEGIDPKLVLLWIEWRNLFLNDA